MIRKHERDEQVDQRKVRVSGKHTDVNPPYQPTIESAVKRYRQFQGAQYAWDKIVGIKTRVEVEGADGSHQALATLNWSCCG